MPGYGYSRHPLNEASDLHSRAVPPATVLVTLRLLPDNPAPLSPYARDWKRRAAAGRGAASCHRRARGRHGSDLTSRVPKRGTLTLTIENWCTLGPSSLNDHVIVRLEEAGVSPTRLILSNTKMAQLPGTLEYVQDRTRLPICLDTEGAQVPASASARIVDENRWIRAPQGTT